MTILKTLLSQMTNLQEQAKAAINKEDWNLLNIIEVKVNDTYNAYQKVASTANVVIVSSLRITTKTIELVSECLGRNLTSEEVKTAITENEVTLALEFTGGYLTK